jgi:CDP-glucose 4,6-dehydratase
VGLGESALEGLAMSAVNDASFWRGKRVLLTGHTGFKGAWLTLWLERLGAEVTGIALAPATTPNLYSAAKIEALCRSHFCDIRDAAALAALIRQAQPDIVFHLAAQALVREGYRDPLLTFASNVMGSAHVLDALRGLDGVRVAVMITTDKVYRDSEPPRPYREDDALGGHDPYSASKAACELVIAGYRDSFLDAQGVAVASARAGNVIGGGDWSDDRLIPDAVRAWQAGKVLHLRRPLAVRPWQYVLEPLAGYLTLAQKLWQNSAPAGAYNFGPAADAALRVREVIELARSAYGKGAVTYGDGSDGPREAAWLALEVSKARELLGVAPALPLARALARTMAWYRAYGQGADARTLCEADLDWFETQVLAVPAAGKRAAGG